VSAPSRRLLIVLAAGWLTATGPAGAQVDSRAIVSEQFRPVTTFVTITVPPSAYDPATGVAVVTVSRAVLGRLRSSDPWTLLVRTDGFEASGPGGSDGKPSSDLAIRASGDAGFKPLSTSPFAVHTGPRTSGWIDVVFDLQLTARLTDVSGAYRFRLFFEFN